MHSLVQAIKLKEIPPKLLCLVSLSSNDKNIKISKKRRCRGGRVGDFQVNKIKILFTSGEEFFDLYAEIPMDYRAEAPPILRDF